MAHSKAVKRRYVDKKTGKKSRSVLQGRARKKQPKAAVDEPKDTFPSTVWRIKPGEARNPKGVNQYTYRRDAEATFDELMKGVDLESGLPVAERILGNIVAMARDSDKWAMERILERILPKIDRSEVVDPEADRSAIAGRLREWKSKRQKTRQS